MLLRLVTLACLLITQITPAIAEEKPSYTIVKDKNSTPILSPAFADRKVLKLKLANGLEAYIVSDPRAEQSAASLSVEAGSWEDPVEYPGIAHFLEHMLFLGTKKYPEEAGFSAFVSGNGGMTNAFTQDLATTYIFTINNKAFSEGIDRFSSFFKEPLFNPSGVSRELNAIDQEYAKNLDDDSRRLFSVIKELANPQHPAQHFSMGNSQTLSKVSQETLKNWYKQNYSANLMHLAIYSPLPIDDLKKLVVDNFSDIPNSNKTSLKLETSILNPALGGNMVFVPPIKNLRRLTLAWEIPPALAAMNLSKPDVIVGYVLGDEGPKSLLANLKKDHLAENVSAGGIKMGHYQELFFIQIDLTEEGLKNVNLVIQKCFQAIQNFKEKGPEQYLFNDIQKIQKNSYQYPSPETAFDIVSDDSVQMIEEELATYPEQTQIVQQYDPDAIRKFLALLTPSNAQYFLMADPKLLGIKTDKTEKWLNVPYFVSPIQPRLLDAWSNARPDPEIDLPQPNLFVPRAPTFVNPLNPSREFPHPEAIVDDEKGKLFYAPDNLYLIPEVYCSFEIKSPQVDEGDPIKVVLSELYTKCMTEVMNEWSYPAKSAGLTFEIKRSENYGILLTLDGFSETLTLLVDELLRHLPSLQISETRFNLIHESLEREYLNTSKELSIEKAKEIFKSVAYKEFVTDEERSKAIQNVTYHDFLNYVKDLFKETYVDGLIYGNMTKEQAKDLWQKLDKGLNSKTFPKNRQQTAQLIQLPKKGGPFFLLSQAKNPGNAALLAIENPPFSFKVRAAQQVIAQAIEEPFFSALRTKQQTGYIVQSTDVDFYKHLYLLFLDQSNTHNPRDLLARFETVLEEFVQEIDQEMPLEIFERVKVALIEYVKQPPSNMKKMGELLTKLAFHYGAEFDWTKNRVKGLEELTYEECIQFAKENLGRANRQRVGILVQGVTPEEKSFQYNELNEPEELKKLSTYSEVAE